MQRISSERVRRLLRASSQSAFRRAYEQVRLEPQKYLEHLRRTLGKPIYSIKDLAYLNDDELNGHAITVVRSSAKLAALEGIGLGLGGLVTTLPDFGILAAITIRMLQKLSLTYGFDYSSDDEMGNLWLAAASAAGLDYGREFIEKQAMERLVPRIVDQVALRAGAEVAEKWAARIIPVLSAGTAGALNYWFVRSWGRRAQQHLLKRRQSLRLPSQEPDPLLLPSTSAS